MVIGAADVSILLFSILFGLFTSQIGLNFLVVGTEASSIEWTAYVVVIMGILVSMGLYNPDYMFDMREAVTRLITGFIIAFVLVSVLLGLIKTAPLLRQALPPTMALRIVGLLGIR